MAIEQIKVTFQPSGRTVYVLSGTTMLEAAAEAGMNIDTPCGGQGTCGKCRVRIVQGACKPCAGESAIFSRDQLADGWRLACQTKLCAAAVVEIPGSSLFADKHQILVNEADRDVQVVPAVRKIYVELPQPSLHDDLGDLERIARKVGSVQADFSLLRRLGALLRAGGFCGTAVVCDHQLVDFEPGDTAAKCYGAAFDIGTTTLVGSLMDLSGGEELAIVSGMNPQVSFGDDVVSRIRHAGQGPEELAELRDCILQAVGEMIERLCKTAGVSKQHVYQVAFAGNTTMQHLLCGLDVRSLGQSPFVPVCSEAMAVRSVELGLSIHPRAGAYVFPSIGGFVGGDTVAGVLATRLAEQDGPSLLVDIGTNGEVVLAHNGEMLAASTAAGPAFEGARISCGMRATAGAIEKIVFDGEVRLGVIGQAAPIGLCGSGLVDVAAELLRAGIVTSDGRMLAGDELPAGLPDWLARRCQAGQDGQPSFLLASAASCRVAITQRDIRELQLAAGAIRAGINMLLKQADLTAHDLRRVFIAGGFGSFIRRSNAQRIGLIPPKIDHQLIHFVGNTSLAGSRWALLSTAARGLAQELARHAKHVELSCLGDFQMEFAESMIFPEA
ncbi:MAG: DUF4445 domain-containing protein [Planctomycetes bacterium]|nr:DUF4445 domain-containing protein [Planctomycetota bacterium]